MKDCYTLILTFIYSMWNRSICIGIHREQILYVSLKHIIRKINTDFQPRSCLLLASLQRES